MCGVKQYLKGVVFGLFLVAGGMGCSGDEDNRIVEAKAMAAEQSCVVCHTDQQILMELAVEKPAGQNDAGET